MSNKLKNIYTNAFDNIIKKHTRDKANTIFVLAGITPYIYVENFRLRCGSPWIAHQIC